MAQLHLRLRPGQRGRAFEGIGVLMLVDRHRAAPRARTPPPSRRRSAPCRRPERAGAGAARIPDRARCRRCWTSAVRRSRRRRCRRRCRGRGSGRGRSRSRPRRSPRLRRPPDGRPTAPARPGCAAGASPGWRPAAARYSVCDEELGEGLVRRVGERRRQHDLGIGGDLDVARPVARIGDRHAPDLGIVLRRHDDVEGRGERCRRAARTPRDPRRT